MRSLSLSLDRVPRRFPILVLAVFLGLAALLLTPTLGDMGGDSAQYLSLAKSLVEGEGYRDAHLYDRPLHGHFPPGLPLLLLPVVGLFGSQAWLAAKILLVLIALVGLAVAFLYLERRFGSWIALASIVLTITSGSFLTTSVRVQSEMPYLLASFLSLLLLEDKRSRSSLFAAWSAFSLRLMGVASLLTWAVHAPSANWQDQGKSRWMRLAARLAVALLPALIFWGYGRLWSQGTWGYGQELLDASGGVSGLPLHLFEGLRLQILHLGRLLGDGVWVSQWPWLQGALAGLIILGLVRRLRGGLQAGESFFLLSFALAVLAPRPLERYLIPLMPLAAAYALESLRALPELWSRLRRVEVRQGASMQGYTLLLSLVLLVASHAHALSLLYGVRLNVAVFGPPPLLAQEVSDVAMNEWEEGWIFGSPGRVAQIQKTYADYLMTLELCRQRLPEDAVLIAAKPRLVSYLTDRPCLALPTGKELGLQELAGLGATHLLIDGLFASTRKALPGGGDRLGLRSVAAVRSCACFLLDGARE